MSLHTVCSETELAVGEKIAFKAGKEDIIVFHLQDGFYATQARCTHLFKTMTKGKIIDDKMIQCPLHKATFDIRTGEVDQWANFPPGIQLLNVVRAEKALKTYPVAVVDGQIQVEVAEEEHA
jgi:3-phenylpropionate/trans-cinnamate dioxygenase ferredoxin subunit